MVVTTEHMLPLTVSMHALYTVYCLVHSPNSHRFSDDLGVPLLVVDWGTEGAPGAPVEGPPAAQRPPAAQGLPPPRLRLDGVRGPMRRVQVQDVPMREGGPEGDGGPPPWRPASWADDVDRDLGPEGLMISGLYQVGLHNIMLTLYTPHPRCARRCLGVAPSRQRVRSVTQAIRWRRPY